MMRCLDADTLRSHLAALGFERVRAGMYRHGAHAFRVEHGWGVLEREGEVVNGRPAGGVGEPGVWRGAGGPGAPRVFEIPPGLLVETEPAETDGDRPLCAALRWGLATAGGAVPRDWDPPAEDRVREWIPEESLVVQVGPRVRHGTLDLRPDRFAVRFRLTGSAPDLPRARARWLREVLAHGAATWRLVRVGLDGADRPLAEIDLTGVPPDVAETVTPVAVEALRRVVGWLVPTVGFIADRARPSAALEAHVPGSAPDPHKEDRGDE